MSGQAIKLNGNSAIANKLPHGKASKRRGEQNKMTVKISRKDLRYLRHQKQSDKRNESLKQLQWELNAQLDKNFI